MEANAEIRYTKDHEWARKEGALIRIGISDYAQRELGDVVFADVPAAGKVFAKGDTIATVESVKAVSDVYAPLSCKVIEGNSTLAANPEFINQDPEGQGWFALVEPTSPGEFAELMDAAEYAAYVADVSK